MRPQGIEVFRGAVLLGLILTAMPAPAATAPHRRTRAGHATKAAADSVSLTSVLGAWHGRSDCVQKGTACNDEITQYHFMPAPGDPDSLRLDAEKLVNGTYASMGILTFGYDPVHHTWSSEFGNGNTHVLWSFEIAGDRLVGSCVRLPDRTPVRRVSAVRGLDPRPGKAR